MTMTTTLTKVTTLGHSLFNLRASFKLRFVDYFQIEQFVILLTTLPESQTVSPQLQPHTYIIEKNEKFSHT